MNAISEISGPNWYQIPANVLEVGWHVFEPETRIASMRMVETGTRRVIYAFTLSGGSHHGATLITPAHFRLLAMVPSPAPSPPSP